MSEKLESYEERIAMLKADGKLTPEAEALLGELCRELAESARSNRALRKAALKAAGGQAMSSRLRDALYE
ncbi:hypothetical protein J2Z22_003071 [Paenibacillus forsythiae]|uniref:Ni2+-binding GTPase n=1 Tax=Paenibacillus forsythiae TaxID=365616 RepID=A0ABU3H9K4_9BACL|nr:hypothetical protein [Paenibacillus forsythiae]MDT3427508.1 hypothetical protein [Paenibacillus forsythiae]